MEKKFVRFIDYGKRLLHKNTKKEYIVVDTDVTRNARKQQDAELFDFLCVERANYSHYERLGAWIRNNVDPAKTESYKIERASFEMLLKCDEVESLNEIEFITPAYKEKFKVRNFGWVSLSTSDKPKQVVYYDATHFGFLSETGYVSNVYHICQFAEMCERNGIEVKPYGATKGDCEDVRKLIAAMKRICKQYIGTTTCPQITDIHDCFVEGTNAISGGRIYYLWFVGQGSTDLFPIQWYSDIVDIMGLHAVRDKRAYLIDLSKCTVRYIRDRQKFVNNCCDKRGIFLE